MEVIQAILFVLFCTAIGLLFVGPFAIVRAWAYRRIIQAEVSARGGRLVRIYPTWLFRIVVSGLSVGRRIRFPWIDEVNQLHVSECEIVHKGMERPIGRGRFRWLGDVRGPLG